MNNEITKFDGLIFFLGYLELTIVKCIMKFGMFVKISKYQ